MDLEGLIERARRGDLDAFAEVTRRFQQMAFGYAVALLRDLQQAEDVVQESFVAAWFGLLTLADPAAFPGWFRSIVRHQAHRLLRQRHLEALPLTAAEAVTAEDVGPEHRLEQGQRLATVLDAIGRLPAPLREVVTLFYVHECTQQDIATFLGIPVTTVNNRLHAARAAQAEDADHGQGHAGIASAPRRLRGADRPHRAGARGGRRGALRPDQPAGPAHRAHRE